MSDKGNALVLSVKLENGHFETTLRVPFPCTVEAGKAAMEQWFDLAMTGLRIGATEIVANLNNANEPRP